MRIVHTIAGLDLSFGGPSRSVPALCSAINSCGADAVIVSQALSSDFQTAVPPNVRLVFAAGKHFKRFRLTYSSSFRQMLRQTCLDPRAQLVHDHGAWLQTNWNSHGTARSLNLPYINSPRGMLSANALKHNSWKKRIAWRAYQSRLAKTTAAFAVTSAAEAADLRRLGIMQPIAIIPNGVAIPADPNTSAGNDLSPRRATFIGRIHPTKGLVELIDAWSKVRPIGWTLTIAGPDENGHARDLQHLISKLALTSEVRLVGPVDGDAKDRLLRASQLFVSATHTESFGLSIAEALAYALPVLTTTGAPWPELKSQGAGWWVPVRNGASLVAALQEATSMQPSRLMDIGHRGRSLVATSHSWSRAASQTLALYEWILGTGPIPATLYNA